MRSRRTDPDRAPDAQPAPALIPIGHLQPGTPKAEAWQRIFGRLCAPLETAEPFEAKKPKGKMFYLVDRYRAVSSSAEEDALVERLAVEWKWPLDKTWDFLLDEGLPALAEDIEVRMEPASAWPDFRESLRGQQQP